MIIQATLDSFSEDYVKEKRMRPDEKKRGVYNAIDEKTVKKI